jgi:EmrB/QacA subfamily drug resistance transporter
MDAVLLAWVPMAYIMAGAIFLLPFGRLADIYGRKRIYTAGIALFTVSSILLAASSSGKMLIFFRVFQGIGGAMTFGTALAILMSISPAQERGKMLGITIGAVYTGSSVGPFLGGILTQNFGWRSIYIATAPLGLAILAAVFWKLKGEWAEAKGEKFDLMGSIVYCLALAMILYGFHLLPAIAGFSLLSVGLVVSLLFVAWETRVKNPVLDLTIFRQNRVFVLSNFATFSNYSATHAISLLISLYLQYIKQLTPQGAGLLMISQPFIQALFSPYAGKLSDRIEPRIVASFGMGLTVVGLLLFSSLGESTPLWFIVLVLALHGLGFGLFSSPNTNAVMSSVETRLYGVASGVVSTTRLIGNSFSIGAVMIAFSLYLGQVQITPRYYPDFLASISVIFVVFAFLCLAGLLASLARGKMR